eukprot:5365679-Pleurochrysis_carterae.AAC.4
MARWTPILLRKNWPLSPDRETLDSYGSFLERTFKKYLYCSAGVARAELTRVDLMRLRNTIPEMQRCITQRHIDVSTTNRRWKPINPSAIDKNERNWFGNLCKCNGLQDLVLRQRFQNFDAETVTRTGSLAHRLALKFNVSELESPRGVRRDGVLRMLVLKPWHGALPSHPVEYKGATMAAP